MAAPLLTLSVALLVGTPGYAELSRDAEKVPNLGRLLEGYLEDCQVDTPGFDKAGCEARAKAAQKKADGQLLEIELSELDGNLSFAGWDQRKQAFRLHLVPLFDERGLAMSVGKPKKLDAEGRPVLGNIPIWVKKPDGEPELIFKKRLQRGMVRLALLVKPKRPWRMKRKQGDDIRGMEVELVALRLLAARGGEILAEETYGRR
ncbi:MAG: hypothetical protein KC933_13995 [Myxococcales bacterium]|nr:hypothetical protein [Myxococcales bacterium]MCB9645161.1 hypothetical protein [Deltaproteobacteria bacterium]